MRLDAKSRAILVEIGRVMHEDDHDRRIRAEMLESARINLGNDQYEAERRIGEQLSLPEAIELTDSVLLAVASDSSAPEQSAL